MKKRGFTLIEVMVVLSILAIIAILAYNMFGSMLKEANEKYYYTSVYKNMNALMQGYEEMQRKGLKMDGTWDLAGQDLVNAGILRAKLYATADVWKASDGDNVFEYHPNGWMRIASGVDLDADGSADFYLANPLANTADRAEICHTWNLIHTGQDIAGVPSGATADALAAGGHQTFCRNYGGSTNALVMMANHVKDILP